MTNFEKYKGDIAKLRNKFAIDKHTMKAGDCSDVTCMFCLFHNVELMCTNEKLGWLCEEYQDFSTDWSKVPIDTKVLASDDGQFWYECHFAGAHHKSKTTPLVWLDGKTSWSTRFPEQKEMFNYVKLAEEE